MLNPLCIEHCKNYQSGCYVGDPRNVQGAEQTGMFCRHYTCKHGMESAKTAQQVERPKAMGTVDGIRNLVAFNTTPKHGDGVEYQRYVDSDNGTIYSISTDGRICPTGQQVNLRN